MALPESELVRRVGVLASVLYPRGHQPPAAGAADRQAAGVDEADRLISEMAARPRAPSWARTVIERAAAAWGVPVGYLTDEPGAEAIELQLRILAELRRWDDHRLRAVVGERAYVFPLAAQPHSGARWANPVDQRPVCLRAVTSWRPQEDELRSERGRDTALWRRCQTRVRELDRAVGLTGPLVAGEFIDRLAAYRGRAIELRPFQHAIVPGGICGLWVDQVDRDVIGYPVDARHALHIIFHEVGHMISEHRGRAPVADSQLASFMPDLDPAMVQSVLGRSVYSTDEEREAELIASLAMERATASRGRPSAPPDVDPVGRRVHSAFGG